MKKLIELLNEYDEDSWYMNGNSLEPVWCDVYWMPCGESIEHCIISKSYGFIKWLVENDKIDDDKCNVIKDIYNDELPKKYTRYDTVLMWLSIQDKPIEFLISILK